MWATLLAVVSAVFSRLTSLLGTVAKETAVEVIKEAQKTPEYSATTKAVSVAPLAEKTRVVETIKNSKLWDALHKK